MEKILTDKVYIGAIIADIHFGRISPDILTYELNTEFLDYLDAMKILDYVVIAGDLFDTKLSLNSEHVKHSMSFLKRLIQICKTKNSKIRIINGTESHDYKQLETIDILFSTSADIKIITNVSEEELFPGIKVLYIPEEYVHDKDEYYKEYLSKSDKYYDLIFGHGMFSEVGAYAQTQTSEITMSKAPVFKSKEICRIVKGGCYFGHIHTPQVIRDLIYYTGSFTRWVFGEEEDKGFMISTYYPDRAEAHSTFICNKLAPEYNTMRVDIEENIDDPMGFIKELDKQITRIKGYKTRLILTIKDTVSDYNTLALLLQETYSKRRDFTFILKIETVAESRKREADDKIKAIMKTYSFIFDKGTLPEEKLSLFIKKKYNKDIPTDRLKRYLYDNLDY